MVDTRKKKTDFTPDQLREAYRSLQNRRGYDNTMKATFFGLGGSSGMAFGAINVMAGGGVGAIGMAGTVVASAGAVAFAASAPALAVAVVTATAAFRQFWTELNRKTGRLDSDKAVVAEAKRIATKQAARLLSLGIA